MKTLNDIHFELNVPVSPDRAYQAISEVRKWWACDTEGRTSARGDSFTVHFGETFVEFEVTEARQGSRYVWHVKDCFLHWIEDKTEWKGTDVVFDIVPTPEGSTIEMVHQGVNPGSECYEDCLVGWEHHVMSSLRKLLTTGVGSPMPGNPAQVALGNHMAVIAPRSAQTRIREFYGDVLGFEARVLAEDVDRFQLGETHYCFVYQESALEEANFLKATYLELKTDKVEDMRRRILDFGVKQLAVPDPHLYFQAPGGQVFRLVGIDEDLSLYEQSSSSRPLAQDDAAG